MNEAMWVVAHDPAVAADMVRGVRGLGVAAAAIVIGGGDAVPGADVTVLAAAGDDALIEGYAQPVASLLGAKSAGPILFASDAQSRLLAGMVAALLRASVRNVTDVKASEAGVVIERAVYGGLAVATETLGEGPAVLIVGPGALSPDGEAGAVGTVEQLPGAPSTPGLRVVERRPRQVQSINLASAKRVVGVGRGFAAEGDLALARELAAKLGAELACSRPIAEGVHWLPVERYIGVSGATIRPDLYVLVGISGQVQHMVGANRSKVIVAINKDKNAPVFAHADYGIVGDLYTVLPALAQVL